MELKTRRLTDHIKSLPDDSFMCELLILGEEFGELWKAISHNERPDRTGNMKEVIEEMAHVYASLDVIRSYYGITQEELQAEIDRKYAKFGLTHTGA